jgi:hypothetical protein
MEISSADEFLVPVWSQLGKRVYSGEEKYTLVSPGVSQGLDSPNEMGTLGTAGYSVDIAPHLLSLAGGSE